MEIHYLGAHCLQPRQARRYHRASQSAPPVFWCNEDRRHGTACFAWETGAGQTIFECGYSASKQPAAPVGLGGVELLTVVDDESVL